MKVTRSETCTSLTIPSTVTFWPTWDAASAAVTVPCFGYRDSVAFDPNVAHVIPTSMPQAAIAAAKKRFLFVVEQDLARLLVPWRATLE